MVAQALRSADKMHGHAPLYLRAHTIPLFVGSFSLGLRCCDHKVGYPKEGVSYEPAGIGS